MGVADNAALQMFYMVQAQDSEAELLQIRLQRQMMSLTIQVFVAAQKSLLKDAKAQEIIQSRIKALNDAENELDKRIAVIESTKQFAEAGEPAAKEGMKTAIGKLFGK
jgi:hypothetical protein